LKRNGILVSDELIDGEVKWIKLKRLKKILKSKEDVKTQMKSTQNKPIN
jgi:hypothetical protein